MNYKKIIQQVVDLSKEVGIYLREEQQKLKSDDIERKGQHDFVSYVDKTAERKLIEKLKVILPEAGFIAEENSEKRVDKDLMTLKGAMPFLSLPMVSEGFNSMIKD